MIKICILGYGVVGTGVTKLINKFNSSNPSIEICKILVKNKSNHKNKEYYSKTTEDISDIYSCDCDIIIEVMGGISPTYEYIKNCLSNKKHIISANKDLVAEYGSELLNLAKQNNVFFKFEAAVGGGIPIIKSMTDYLKFTKINKIKAILNGTTNYMLTQMGENNLSYDEALIKAQNLGFAESNPYADVEGYDAARKLSILSSIAFKGRLNLEDINIEGITKITKSHFNLSNKLNYKIKLIAFSEFIDGKVTARVQPAFVSIDSPFYNIDSELNSVLLDCEGLGCVTFTGNGAGMIPTATSIFSDLNDIISNVNFDLTQSFKDTCSISNNNDQKWTGVIYIDTSKPEEIYKLFENKFKPTYVNIQNEDQNLTLIGDFNSYSEITYILNKIKIKPYVKEISKFSIF